MRWHFQIQEDVNWNLPAKLLSYGEYLSEKFGQHDVPSSKIANMTSLREIYDVMRFGEIWNIIEEISI